MRSKPGLGLVLGTAGVFLAMIVSGQNAADQIIFPHGFHVEDMEIDCAECHTGLEGSTELSHKLLPLMDQCLDCHDGDTASEECELCHTNPDEADTYGWLPTKGLIFPHATHLVNGTECSKCHPGKASAEALATRLAPTMGACMYCHQTPITDSGCLDCHATLENKLPASHGIGWEKTHGIYAPGTCSTCHQVTDCESCHAQAQFEKRVHPANYEFLHAGDFFGFELECSTCHSMSRDCSSCHHVKGVMPMSHNSPYWAGDETSGLHFHADEAMDKPDYCQVCHEPAVDMTCQRLECHGSNTN